MTLVTRRRKASTALAIKNGGKQKTPMRADKHYDRGHERSRQRLRRATGERKELKATNTGIRKRKCDTKAPGRAGK